jgi:hypothetical protein
MFKIFSAFDRSGSGRAGLSYSEDFTNASLPLDPRITYTGASARMYFDSTGTLKYAPMNVIRNNTMVGAVAGTPGTLPTNWGVSSTGSGLTRTVVGTGTEDGINYIDVKYAGTTSAQVDIFIRPENIGTQTAASSGQTWTQSFYLRLVEDVGGVFAGLAIKNFYILELNAALSQLKAWLVSVNPTSAALRTQRITHSVTLTEATTAHVWMTSILRIPTATTVDFTLRIGMPQLQLGSEATEVIPTTTAAVYLPRSNAYQDHNPSTLAPLGFLIEEQRTNSIRNNTMQGAVAGSPGTLPTNWVASGLTANVVGAGSEDGIPYIDLNFITGGAVNGAQVRFESVIQIVAAISQVWASSFYCKYLSGSLAGVDVTNNIQERTAAGVFVNETNILFHPTSADLNAQRHFCSRTLTGGAAGTTERVVSSIRFVTSAALDVTLRIGLPQLELGAFATSPILTSGAAATRLADSASITGTNFSSIWNQSEGCIVVKGDTSQGISAYLAGVWGGDVNNRIALNYAASQQFFAGTRYLGTFTLGTLVGSSAPLNTQGAVAFTYESGAAAAAWNGGAVTTGAPAGYPTWIRLDIGNNNNLATNYLNGHIQSLTYYRKRLPNATLQVLSA